MCGIAGIYNYKQGEPVSQSLLQKMTNSLFHRGPDAGGLHIDGAVGLGHRRLSILDLSERGRQPMPDASRKFWISYNGEVYNFPEIRDELISKGHSFVSDSDTEVLLTAFIEWGIDALTKLNGMFAFAIWDVQQQQLTLARDPIGIKPLFFLDDGTTLRFGSEIKAILADETIPRKPDLTAIDAFFSFGYIPAPMTGFDGIQQLMPGEVLIVNKNKVEQKRFAHLPYPDSPPEQSWEKSVSEMKESLFESVKRQMVSDVPIGAFLSGGVDSSAVVWAMRNCSERKPRSFCIGFNEKSFDETPYAQEVAETLGADFLAKSLTPHVEEMLPKLVTHADSPLADASALPVFMLSEMTREHVTVSLSGDGADELLAGYATYQATNLARKYRMLPKWMRGGIIQPLVNLLPPSDKKYSTSMFAKRFVAAAHHPFPHDHCRWRQMFSNHDKAELYSPEMQQATKNNNPFERYAETLDDAPEWLSPLEKMLHIDTRFHLTNDMLVKVDRMSMAHSLEVRVPLLDLEFVKNCLVTPPAHKHQGKKGKLALKSCLEEALPRSIIERKKAGFVIPLEAWFRGPLLPMLRDIVSPEFLKETGLFNVQQVEKMINDHVACRKDYAYQLYCLLIFGMWWRIWISRSIAEKPVVVADVDNLLPLADASPE